MSILIKSISRRRAARWRAVSPEGVKTFSWSEACWDRSSLHIDRLPASTARWRGILPWTGFLPALCHALLCSSVADWKNWKIRRWEGYELRWECCTHLVWKKANVSAGYSYEDPKNRRRGARLSRWYEMHRRLLFRLLWLCDNNVAIITL